MADEINAIVPPHLVVDDIPVISPASSVTSWTAIVTAVGNLVVLLTAQFGVPLDAKGIVTLAGAFNVIMAIVVWVRNTYFRNSVTISSLDLETKKSMRRVE